MVSCFLCLSSAVATVVLFLVSMDIILSVHALSGKASFTYYVSYAACCPANPNYDANADDTECVEYSACDYSGDFWAIGHKSFDYVQNNSLVAFYDSSDKNGKRFDDKYGGKNITLTKGAVTFTAVIADSCADSDCDGCCTQNAKPSGFLVDMEYWTVMNHFGSVDLVDGQIEFEIVGVPDHGYDMNHRLLNAVYIGMLLVVSLIIM